MNPDFGTNAQAYKPKRVKYTGSKTLRLGMPLSYDWDTTTNVLGVNKADNTRGTTTADGYQNEGKFKLVEDPSLTNQRFFAGLLHDAKNLNKTADGAEWVDIVVPNGAIVPAYTDRSVAAGDAAYLEPGENTVVNTSTEGGSQIGFFLETVDRSSTAGLALVKLSGPTANTGGDSMSPRGRAATALPTAAIWQNFDLDALRRNPMNGSLFETDYTHGEAMPLNIYVSATYAASAEGKSITEYIRPGVDAVGSFFNFVTTDNQAVEWQVPCPITVSGGNKWAMEIRLKRTELTDDRAGFFVGLLKPQIMSGDILTDAGAIIDGGALGFQNKEGDGDIIDFVYDETSQTQNEHDDDYATLVADTYLTLGMYFNGTTIQGYVDGVLTGTAISAADIAAADFPTAEVLCPTFALKGANAADASVAIDWIRVAQTA
jgi:hypothetical protein